MNVPKRRTDIPSHVVLDKSPLVRSTFLEREINSSYGGIASYGGVAIEQCASLGEGHEEGTNGGDGKALHFENDGRFDEAG